MKKHLILLLLPALLCACSSELTEEPEFSASPDKSNVIAIDEAIAIALEHSLDYPQEVTSRAATTRTVDPKNVVVKKTLSRSGSEPLYYIVNFDDAQGYAIVPAVKIGEPILGFVPEGSYTEGSNPALEEYLAMAEDYIAQQSTRGIIPIDPPIGPIDPIPQEYWTSSSTDTNYYYHLEPRMPQEWGQEDIYGRYCPNFKCGCAPLAIATIAVWTNFKAGVESSRLVYDFEERDCSYEVVTWAELFKHRWITGVYNNTIRTHLCYTHQPEEVHRSIGRLCRQIGEDTKTMYQTSPISTGTYKQYLESALKKYVPSSYAVTSLASYDYRHVNYYLDRGLLLLRADNKAAYLYGHVWVGDGYHIVSIRHTTVYHYNDKITPDRTEYYDENICQIHMRWGYDGRDDGYFSGNIFNNNGQTYQSPEFIAVYNQ